MCPKFTFGSWHSQVHDCPLWRVHPRESGWPSTATPREESSRTHAAPLAGCSGKLREGNKTTKWQGHQDGTERCTSQLLLNCHHHSVVTHTPHELWLAHIHTHTQTQQLQYPLLSQDHCSLSPFFFLSFCLHATRRNNAGPLRKPTGAHTRNRKGVLLLSGEAWRRRDWHETTKDEWKDAVTVERKEGVCCCILLNERGRRQREEEERGWVRVRRQVIF